MSRILHFVFMLSFAAPVIADDGSVDSDQSIPEAIPLQKVYVHPDIAVAAQEWTPERPTSAFGNLVKIGGYSIIIPVIVHTQNQAITSLPLVSHTLGLHPHGAFAPLVDLGSLAIGGLATGAITMTVNRALKSRIQAILHPERPLHPERLKFEPSTKFLTRLTGTFAAGIGMAHTMPQASHICAKVIATITQAL